MTKRLRLWAGSLLAAIGFGAILFVLDAPRWAVVGLPYVTFMVWRLGDRLGVH